MKLKKTLFNITLLVGIVFASSLIKETRVSALSAQAINVTNTDTETVRNYYSALSLKSESDRKGEALLASLKPILSNGHKSFDYQTVWDWTKVTDRDWDLSPMSEAQINSYNFNDNPYVKLLYRSDNGTATAAQHNATHGQIIDREHVWPKSLGNFGQVAPAGTDLHHLMLADSNNNQTGHNNYPYGNVNPNSYTPIATAMGNYTGKRGTITYQGNTYTVYEPQDEDKGDIARAMFYMAARYSGYTSSSDPYLKLSNTPNTVTTSSSLTLPGQAGLLDTLLMGHEQDPVSDYEIRRNNLIYNNAQFNRNPFIDYPSWVNAIWGDKTPANPSLDDVTQFGVIHSISPTSLSLSPSSLSINVGESEVVNINVIPTNASKSVSWDSSNPSVASVSSSGEVTGVSVGTTIITATSTLDNNVKGTITVSVINKPVISLTSINVSNYAPSVKLGNDYDLSMMQVSATYSDGSSADVKDNAIIEVPNTNQLGEQVLTISYQESNIIKHTTYSVRVTNNGVIVGNLVTYARDLFISEYIEGSSNNKYLEIYNGTGGSVDLSDYNLQLFSNGAATPTNNVNLSGALPHDSVVVYKNTNANLTLPSGVTAIINSAINYNGDDAIALYKISTNSYVDIFGTIGSRPNEAWTGEGVTTKDKTLVRKPNVYEGIRVNPLTFDPSIEWIQFDIDNVSNLGSHLMEATMMGISSETQANAWATYFLDKTSSYCEDLNGGALITSLWTIFAQEYAYMDDTSKQLFLSTISDSDGEGIAGAKARYVYLINKYSSLSSNNFMKDSAGNEIFLISNQQIPDENNQNKTFAFLIIGSITILAFGGIIYKKRSSKEK